MNLVNTKSALCAAIGSFFGMIATFFGGWSSDMATLLIFMAIDFVMGLIVAGVFKNSEKSPTGALDSHAGWMGLCKKGATLLFVLVAHRLDVSLGVSYIRTASIIAFVANEAISILENAGLMGIPLPEIIKKAVEVLRNKTKTEIH